MKRKNTIFSYICLVPMILIMGTLVFYPVAVTFVYSLKRWNLTQPWNIKFIGLQNYLDVLTDSDFLYSLENTAFIMVLLVVVTTAAGFLIALMLHTDSKMSGLLLAFAILPWALPPYVNGIMWKFIFYSGYGFLNKVCILTGLAHHPVEWLGGRWTLLIASTLVAAWRATPFTALVCLSGRSAIPQELYEAGEIDGASKFQLFRRITLPMLKPFLGISITQASIAGMNIFDEIVALNGFNDIGKNLSMESYLTTFSFLNFGKGSAITYLIMLLTALLGVFYLKSRTMEVG